jgi:hypothetical protein
LKGKKKDFVNSTRSLESFSKNFSCDTREWKKYVFWQIEWIVNDDDRTKPQPFVSNPGFVSYDTDGIAPSNV